MGKSPAFQYELSRGLSANFGLSQEDATFMVGDTLLLDSRDTKSVFPLGNSLQDRPPASLQHFGAGPSGRRRRQ